MYIATKYEILKLKSVAVSIYYRIHHIPYYFIVLYINVKKNYITKTKIFKRNIKHKNFMQCNVGLNLECLHSIFCNFFIVMILQLISGNLNKTCFAQTLCRTRIK